jgi:hypothetical protein
MIGLRLLVPADDQGRSSPLFSRRRGQEALILSHFGALKESPPYCLVKELA